MLCLKSLLSCSTSKILVVIIFFLFVSPVRSWHSSWSAIQGRIFFLGASRRTSKSSMRMSTINNSNDSPSILPKNMVIAGAGVIGTSTAYYLWENFGVSTTLVDPTGRIAPAASGKAGGFLALDWNDMSPVGPLARRSFHLHQELADKFGADAIQYRRLSCAAISVNAASNGAKRPGGKKLAGVEWAQDVIDTSNDSSSILGMRKLGDETTIAQVHPKLLCESLWRKASQADGAKVVKGKVIAPVFESNKLVGARLDDGSMIKADAVLFACGPWSANIMTGVKYHSVIIPTPRVLSQSVFFDGCGDPEVYPRPDSTAYCTGFPDPPTRVKECPGEEEVRPEAVERIVDAVRAASGGTSEGAALAAAPTIEQACYLPSTADGLPVMGRLPSNSVGGDGCYIASGHSCWGILMSLATGEAMASLIATGKETEHVSLRSFDPSRFSNIELIGSLSKA